MWHWISYLDSSVGLIIIIPGSTWGVVMGEGADLTTRWTWSTGIHLTWIHKFWYVTHRSVSRFWMRQMIVILVVKAGKARFPLAQLVFCLMWFDHSAVAPLLAVVVLTIQDGSWPIFCHLQVTFHKVIGEPVGAHSADCIWRNSYKCYKGGKNCCYTVLGFLCGLPMAFVWGCTFACIMFEQIWCITPCVKCFNMIFKFFARMWYTCAHCLYEPVYESAALMCTQIFHYRIKNSKPYESRRVEDINIVVAGTSVTQEAVYDTVPD